MSEQGKSQCYIISTEQLNVILSMVTEMKLKDGIGSYQVIQQVLRRPYIQPLEVVPTPEHLVNKVEEAEIVEETVVKKKITDKKKKTTK